MIVCDPQTDKEKEEFIDHFTKVKLSYLDEYTQVSDDKVKDIKTGEMFYGNIKDRMNLCDKIIKELTCSPYVGWELGFGIIDVKPEKPFEIFKGDL